MHFPDRLDQLLGTARRGHVDDREARTSSRANRLSQPLQRFHDHDVTRLTQPALEQAENQVVRFDDQYSLLLLHETSAQFRADSPDAGAPCYRFRFHAVPWSRLSTDRAHSCHMTKSAAGGWQ
jgi:hypothetical protein